MNNPRIANSIQEWYGYEDRIYEEDNGFIIGAIINIQYPPTPYFRLYYGENNYRNLDSSKMCRISLLEPKYLGLEGEDLILNKEQKIRLIEILKSQTDGDNISNWDMIICLYNRFHHDYEQYNNDDFIRLKENMILPNLIIPDYTKLPGGD